jgi:hypothetical protein
MRINSYSFGAIEIDGKHYTKDVIIFPDRVISPWWRKEGHLLQIEDLKDYITDEYSKIIIGTGYYGTMRVSEDTLMFLKEKGLETVIDKSSEAVKHYNNLSDTSSVIAAIHLTC